MEKEFTVKFNGNPREVRVEIIIAAVYPGTAPSSDIELDERRGFIQQLTDVAHEGVEVIEKMVRERIEK